ncbi:MAG: divergent polysaccharide deacetylase family protein [Pseudomonadota bacterium]
MNSAALKKIGNARRFWAGAIAAIVGTAAGVSGAVIAGRMGDASAAYSASLDLRDAPLIGASGERSDLIARIAATGAPERLTPPIADARPTGRGAPKLVVIFDDMGLSRDAFDEIMRLPGPVTLSFLPYARNIQPLVDAAAARGDDILLHLPMEPTGRADPGPGALSADMKSDALFSALSRNLGKFDGYVGVNNHMGSKFTRDEQAMKRVLSYLDQRGLFFIDSLTTGSSAAVKAGAAVGADVYVRDVFLDSEPGKTSVQQQLDLAERIALKTGYAIVICHPRRDTLDVIGPWLTTAPARGFDLATVSSLKEISASHLASAAP